MCVIYFAIHKKCYNFVICNIVNFFMSYSFLDFLCLLGSVALFLYGMKVMSEGLQKAAGDRLRNILSAMTRNRFTGMLTGVLITALIQSSSASTVMVVSFVNAGLMSLGQSMACSASRSTSPRSYCRLSHLPSCSCSPRAAATSR